MENLRARLRALHAFVPVYTPWVNGTVERLNREALQVVRALLLEYQLDTKSWEHLVPLVQANLNQTPVNSLGGNAPLELFTGLQVPTQLDTEKTRMYQKMAKEGKLENFSVGDYVLWSRVDERLRGNKLMVRWGGAYRVTEAREYSFMVEISLLVTPLRFMVPGSSTTTTQA
ncbi:hypothetical protein PHYSODRAFT_492634 [Phytophthora sojae]|uniref:Integrase catalytic domain-containing protein n=1 Tax=Phytophthora sojae (strain P6497) TaxID=1094619 RepID=G4Z655_PHYSP|nr:hypothetical protein PHYSODRAFT_492634 [Phytophthora sojae]EGZ20976.1 hypothetical protein PHYSODRAFT_492634 [Phytophthora sojae]|eukprot:XP_009523693.1 hypothetical protein PHYSODRAFT_492634 [Phytophthora sojae]